MYYRERMISPFLHVSRDEWENCGDKLLVDVKNNILGKEFGRLWVAYQSGPQAVNCQVPAGGEQLSPIRWPLLVDMVGSTLQWNGGSECDHLPESGDCVYKRIRSILWQVFCHLDGSHEVVLARWIIRLTQVVGLKHSGRNLE